MQSQEQRNLQFMITKEVFIDHIPSEIQQHYEVNPNCLGEGGFGKVFQARKKRKLSQINNQELLGSSFSSFQTSSRFDEDQQNQGELRAIKQITFKRAEDKEHMKNQIQILSYLDHPSIVKLYETYEHKDQLYLVTDLLKGGDLFEMVNQKDHFDEQQAKLIFQQLIKAICYLHSQHICHRDLKLENILFLDEHSYNLKLIDFGLAFCWDQDMKKQLKKCGQHNKMTGTPEYMSPQMISHNYDQKCDIWSAGVILYILLSGVPPFTGNTDKQLMKKIKDMDFTLQVPEFKDVSSSAKDLLQKIFKPQDERISLNQILSHPWLKQNSCQCKKCSEATSVESISSGKFFKENTKKTNAKFSTSSSFQKVRRKGSYNTYENSEFDSGFRSNCSDQLQVQEGKQQLTVQKMEYYLKLSKLRKLLGIYSVSKLSQSKTKGYGREFLLIDKNNDGTISLQDLTEYLFLNEKFCDKERTQIYFNELSLSQRGYISYTQYLACALSYQSVFKISENLIDQVLDERFLNQKLSLLSQDQMFFQSIDIYDENMIYEFFLLLDKDRDGFISKSDFVYLLQSSGIEDKNDDLFEQIQKKLNEIGEPKDIQEEQQSDDQQWTEDPRKFKERLWRNYKGESDGGSFVDFKMFKHLLKHHSRCLNISAVL